MPNVDETFNWLMRNAFYFRMCYDKNNIQEMSKRFLDKTDDITLDVFLHYTPPFHVPLESFLKFMGVESYSYKKLIEPLVKAKLIKIIQIPEEPHSEERDAVEGLILNYKTYSSFLCFWLDKPIHDERGLGYFESKYIYRGEPT